MPAKSPAKYNPKLHIPLPFAQAVKGLIQVDPKKLPGKGKLTTKAAKKGKKKG